MQLQHDVEKPAQFDAAKVLAPIRIDVIVLRRGSSHHEVGCSPWVSEHLHKNKLGRRGRRGQDRSLLLFVRDTLFRWLDVSDPGVDYPFQLIFEDVERSGGGHHNQRERDDHAGIDRKSVV